jgi:hypothetical protein
MTTTLEAQLLAIHNGNHRAVSSPHATRYTLRRNLVDQYLETLPPEQAGALRWLDQYGRDKDLSPRELAAQIKKRDGSSYDDNTLRKILYGEHEAKPDNFIRAVEEFRKPFTERESSAKIPFLWTSQAKSIRSYVEKCQKYRKMGLIFGRNQSGKTETLRQIALQLPFGQMPIFRVPTNGYLSQLVIRMCKKKRITVGNCVGEMKEDLLDTFTPSMMPVFDEMHQCYSRTAREKKPRLDTFAFAREIYDERDCPVILTATPEVYADMTDGDNALFFEQLLHRSLPPLLLNDLVPTNDLNQFADVLGLDPAQDDALTLQDKVIKKEGLGFWLMYLQCARGIAEKKGRTVAWADVLKAQKTFARMSRKNASAETEDDE